MSASTPGPLGGLAASPLAGGTMKNSVGGEEAATGGAAGSLSSRLDSLLSLAHHYYSLGQFTDALRVCEQVYAVEAHRTDNLLLLGALHFHLRNFSECIFYNQQAIRVDPTFAEAYGNLGNALKELGDIDGAVQFYLKAIQFKPRFCDAYNNLASAYMQLGRTKEAVETFELALMLNPGLVDAHSNLGNLYKAQGKLDVAKRCYLEAIRIKPDFAIAWSNLAGVFKDEGDSDTAIAYYREAIRLLPEFADAHSNLGNVLKETGALEEAMACYREAIRLRPDFGIAHGNLASCFYDAGDVEAAIKTYQYAIQLEPNFPDAYNNLGNALRDVGRLDDAINCYRAALRLKPDHPHAYNNLGNALKDKGMVKEAISCYMTAVRLMPAFPAAHSNLASILKEQGKVKQAVAHYLEAIACNPLFADAYSNLGNAYKDMGRLEEAIRCYTTAIRLRPDFADAYSNLGSAYKDSSRLEDAITCYRKALSLKPTLPDAFSNLVHTLVFISDWSSRDADFAQLRDILQWQLAQEGVLPCVQPFHALVYPFSLARVRDISARFAERAALNVALLAMPRFRFRAKKPHERLRVGYVSSDFGNHPLSHLMRSVFALHDRSQFEVFAYALSPSDGTPWRADVERGAEHFRDISALEHGDAARAIAGDGVHILINLNGYTKGARNEIFALRPAPLQMSYLGFCGTMGADYIDFMAVDRVVIPPHLTSAYTEHLLYLPHSYFVNDHKQSARDVLDSAACPTRADVGIPDAAFVFANFNQVYKIDPSVLDAWVTILSAVPDSVLWLLRFPAQGERNIRREFEARGVPAEQVIFTDVALKMDHIKRSRLADLFLDTPVCNAHTTGCDVLWAGTPVLTVPGERMASRVGASLLHAAGLPELIADTMDDYVNAAIQLATEPALLAELRGRLVDSRDSSPLFDTARWVRNFETGLHMIWARHENGLPATSLDIPDVVDLQADLKVAPSEGASGRRRAGLREAYRLALEVVAEEEEAAEEEEMGDDEDMGDDAEAADEVEGEDDDYDDDGGDDDEAGYHRYDGHHHDSHHHHDGRTAMDIEEGAADTGSTAMEMEHEPEHAPAVGGIDAADL